MTPTAESATATVLYGRWINFNLHINYVLKQE